MNCDEATKLIDRRLDDQPHDANPDWSTLDTHLAGCSACRRLSSELEQTREQLLSLRDDAPSRDELARMWSNIANSGVPEHRSVFKRFRVNRGWGVPASGAAIVAACLIAAFLIGQDRYGPISSRLRPAANIRGIGRALLTYAADGSTEQAKTRGLWSLIHNGQVTPEQFICPSSGERVDELALFPDSTTPVTGYARRLPTTSSVTELRTRADLLAFSDFYNIDSPPSLGSDLVGDSRGESAATGEIRRGVRIVTGGAVAETESSPPSVGIGRESEAARQEAEAPQTVEEAPAPGEGAPILGDAAVGLSQSNAQQSPGGIATKIITTGELTVEVDDFESSAKKVTKTVADHDAVLADSSVAEQSGGSLAGHFVIRVAPQRVGVLLESLKTIGRVEAESVKTADVTADYVDLEARLKSVRLAEQRLLDLMQSKTFVDRMAALLEVERELTRVRSEIERYEGQMRVMTDRVALATITLRIHEPDRPVPEANLRVEVQRIDAAADSLQESLAQLGGQIRSGVVTRGDGGSLVGEYEIRVALTQFDSALRAVSALGRITNRTLRGWSPQDVNTARADRRFATIKLTLFERAIQLPEAQIKIEVADAAEAAVKLSQITLESGGHLVSNNTTQRPDGSSEATIELRVPAGRFAELASRLTKLGRTTAKRVTGTGGAIEGGAADEPCTLGVEVSEAIRQVPRGGITIEVERFPAARDALSDLVDKYGLQVLDASSLQQTDGTWAGRFRLGIRAVVLDDVLARISELGRVKTREIFGAGLGDLSPTNPSVLGVIELALGEKSALNPGPDRTRDSIRQRVRDAFAGFYASIGFVIYGLLVMAPWIVLVLLIGWVVARWWRRRSRRLEQSK